MTLVTDHALLAYGHYLLIRVGHSETMLPVSGYQQFDGSPGKCEMYSNTHSKLFRACKTCHTTLWAWPHQHLPDSICEWCYLNYILWQILILSLNPGPGPGEHGLLLGTVNTRSKQNKAPALSDLVASKGIDLLGITENWLTTKETSADLADMTRQGFSFFHKPRTWRRGGEVGLFVSSAYKFTAISLPNPNKVRGNIRQTWMWSVMPYYPQYLSPTWSCYY